MGIQTTRRRPTARRSALGGLLLAAALAAPAAAQTIEPAAYQGMQWRNIGPFRGGRSVASAGVPSQPYTYYMGTVGGGLWKTEDAGETWRNVSDGFFRTGSVGAIAVAESDANVVYAGMGEHAVRGVMTTHGDGVYRSTDAGRTWTHRGLDRTRQISAVQVHPRDPDLVYVAAQGSPYGANPERGVYRSRDGGANWERVLFVDENSGASSLSMDMSNPRVLYAGFWDHRRLPWFVRSGGPGSGIYKSTDGGDTWTELTEGLPAEMGKVSVSVSRANPRRVYALIEAEEGGLYRSDNAGQSWTRVNSDRELIARAWYYIKVFADPQDEETVYVLNAPMLKSVDGGRTFRRVSTPHGDNHHLWINPLDNRYMVESNDGGANVSLNGGESWSTQENQPTSQFYRVNADRRFPYYVYGGQQDNSSVVIASRTTDGGIDWKDWYEGPGCESAYLAFDKDAPRYVYGGCYQGIIEEFDQEAKQGRAVMAYPVQELASIPRDKKYRFNWNAPIIVSQHDAGVIYHAANVVLRSTDRGQSWTPISPDLTRDEDDKQGVGGGPFTAEGAGGEVYGTIYYLAESPHDAGTLWAGSDDGLVHLTRDGGATWQNVTPRGLPESTVNAIEVSPHDPGTAYLAVTRYKFNDFTPHFYKTTDFGRSWTRIVEGIPAEEWARVVREDPTRRGLLYAATEGGVYVSFNGGARWQPFQLNLPRVPVTDLLVHGNDLVAATHGRAFWILDDLTPVRQVDAGALAAEAALFRPAPAIRMGGFSANAPGLGKNPPNGAILDYELKGAPSEPISLEILDAAGQVIRRFSSAAPDTVRMLSGNRVATRLPAKAGHNRFVWDLRHEPLVPVAGLFINGDLSGRRVVPGTYQARLTVGGQSQSQPLEVVMDPRVQVRAEDFREQDAMLAEISTMVDELHRSVTRFELVREQVDALVERMEGEANGAAPVREAARSLGQELAAWEEKVVQREQKTFQDVINFPNQLNAQLLYLKDIIDGSVPPVTAGARQRLQDLRTEFASRRAERDALLQRVEALNAEIRQSGIPAVVVPK